jgi:hypothetical protein
MRAWRFKPPLLGQLAAGRRSYARYEHVAHGDRVAVQAGQCFVDPCSLVCGERDDCGTGRGVAGRSIQRTVHTEAVYLLLVSLTGPQGNSPEQRDRVDGLQWGWRSASTAEDDGGCGLRLAGAASLGDTTAIGLAADSPHSTWYSSRRLGGSYEQAAADADMAFLLLSGKQSIAAALFGSCGTH